MNPRRAPPFRAISAGGILRRAGGRRIVIVAPHPDDETLGCGSLIALAVRRGSQVALIALTDGDASHPGSRRWPPAALGRLRAGETRRAMARLGAGGAPIHRLGWGDGRLADDADVGRLRRKLVALGAGIVLVTSDRDDHPDHRAAAAVTRAAAAGLGLPVASYAVWSRITSAPRSRDRYRAAKRWAIAAHRSQLGGYVTDDQEGFRLAPVVLASLLGGAEQFASG